MVLDLIIRGTGCSGSPLEHVTAVASSYGDARVILFGPDMAPDAEYPASYQVVADSYALAQAIKELGDVSALIYGGDELLAVARHLVEIKKLWVVLRSGTHEVREVWRLRQQQPWVTSKKLGLLFEKVDGESEPDTKHLMRLTRASEALIVPIQADLAKDVAASSLIPEPAEVMAIDEAQADVELPLEEPVSAPDLDITEPEASAEPPAPEVPEDLIAPEPELEISSLSATVEKEGAIPVMETELVIEEETVLTSSNQPEQALLRRYALVKERRTTVARTAQVQSTMEGLLKDMFVTRFAAGPDAAAAFEQVSRKLTDASAEYTQLSRSMAQLEQQLAKLAWLKDELEI